MRNPPSGVQFHYDAAASHPVAMAMLIEDPNLQKIRFELVPTQYAFEFDVFLKPFCELF